MIVKLYIDDKYANRTLAWFGTLVKGRDIRMYCSVGLICIVYRFFFFLVERMSEYSVWLLVKLAFGSVQ